MANLFERAKQKVTDFVSNEKVQTATKAIVVYTAIVGGAVLINVLVKTVIREVMFESDLQPEIVPEVVEAVV